jgi:hypothetical protein
MSSSTHMAGVSGPQDDSEVRGFGWLVFAGIIMSIAGVLNVVYGIAAIGDASFFVHEPSTSSVA